MSNQNSSFYERVGSPRQTDFYRTRGKRVFDIALTLLILPIVLPIIGVFALVIALDGANPFYSQDQIGRNGRIYRVWKLRLMTNATGILRGRHRTGEGDSGAEGQGTYRFTRLGQFLQDSSLDELPLFFNVLVGDMSIVGPRPMVTSPTALYPGGDYYDLQPGITGHSETVDWHRLTLPQRAFHDARYNRTLSFTNDLAILAAAFRAALYRT